MENTTENKALDIYFYTIRVNGNQTPDIFDLKVIVAREEQFAIQSIRESYPQGSMLNIQKRGQIKVEEFMKVIEQEANKKPGVIKIKTNKLGIS